MRDFTSSYTRVRANLLKIFRQGLRVCQKVTQEDITELRKLDIETEKLKEYAIPKKAPLPPPSVTTSTSMSGLYQQYDSKKIKAGGLLEKA